LAAIREFYVEKSSTYSKAPQQQQSTISNQNTQYVFPIETRKNQPRFCWNFMYWKRTFLS